MASLFIGLGGVGSGTLDFLYDKMDTYNIDLARQNRQQVTAQYYYIDTESARYSQHPEEFIGGNKRFFQIGLYSPESIKNGFRRGTTQREIEQCRLMEQWYDAPPKPTNMIAGADTIRQYSRLALDREAVGIRNDLFTLIQQVTRAQGRIYVITGSCGGTGSGTFMDVLYMISEIYETQNTPAAATDVRLIMAMPEGYVSDGNIDVQFKKKKLNAFATLAELNAICKDKNSIPSLFNNCYIGPFPKVGVFQPFRFGYMFDSAGLKRDEVSQKLSDFLFELELAGDPNQGLSRAVGYNGSFFDGLLTGTVDGNWNNSINNDYVQAFNAMGQYSIEKPDFLYRIYFSDHLLYDVFHKGLIGERGAIDENKRAHLANHLKSQYEAEITNTCNTIKGSIISRSDFENDARADNTFSVFKTPNLQEETVRKIIEKKDILLQTVREKVYRQCKDWLGQYDFTTVYEIFEEMDRSAYNGVLTTNRDFDDQLAKAKTSSLSGIINKSIDSKKALEEFDPLLTTWLTFEVNKALSSGVDVDITTPNQGYFDYCKTFIERAKKALVLDKEQEHWDQSFVKTIFDLKAKEDRSYIPDLNTIVDEQNRIINAPESEMVSIYENSYVNVPPNAAITNGVCTPVQLHEEIISEMKSNPSLIQEGIDMNAIFDPTPGKTNTLRDANKAALFVEKYVAAAKNQIDILLRSNQSYQALFTDDILTRLQNLPIQERSQKCIDFVNYNTVQLKTDDMNPGAVTQYTYYIVSSTANGPLMQALGILDANGQKSANTDHTPANPFFGDKIVKLIIKNGYKIDDYRYFGDYKRFVGSMMKAGETHDPFIDKRFLGELDNNGKYPCDVSSALSKILEDTQAEQQAQQFSLDGCNDILVYQYCLALLLKYFDTLKTGGHIETPLADGITTSGKAISIKEFTFDELFGEYVLSSPKNIDLPTLKDINNIVDMSNWIDYVMKKKEQIFNERALYQEAARFLRTVGVTIDQFFNAKIVAMMGSGNKPVYDFFNAYLDWYNRD